MPHVLILGAGITGLTVAFRLQQLQPTCDITILEPLSRPGGTIWTEQRNGFRVEIGPNGFLDTKPATIQLCRDLGLQDRLVAASKAASGRRDAARHDRTDHDQAEAGELCAPAPAA